MNMAFNWENEIEKLQRSYEQAMYCGDTYAQERIAREMSEAQDFMIEQEMKKQK
jgi:hypothetical protein